MMPSKRRIKAFYEEEGRVFDNLLDMYYSPGPYYNFIHNQRADRIIDLLPLQEYDYFLDIGCGEGFFLARVCRKVDACTGIDIAKTKLLRARKFLAWKTGGDINASFILADAGNLPLPDESFDVVLCSELLEHVPSPLKVIEEVYRVVKRTAIFSAPTYASTIWGRAAFPFIGEEFDLDRSLKKIGHGHLHRFTVNQLLKNIEQAGFEIREIRSSGSLTIPPLFKVGMFSRNQIIHRMLHKLSRLLNRRGLDKAVSNKWPLSKMGYFTTIRAVK